MIKSSGPINLEDTLAYIGQAHAQITRAEWTIGRILLDTKAQLEHGQWGDFLLQVWRVLHISQATCNRYMKLADEFPEPIAQNVNPTALYALMRRDVEQPVRDFCLDNHVYNVAMIDYIVSAYKRRGVSGTWEALRASKAIALEGESVHVSEVTKRDLANMDKERRAVHAEGTNTEYRFSAYFEQIDGNRATLVISGGLDDLAKLAGREGVTIRAIVRNTDET